MRTLTVHTDAYLDELEKATCGFVRRVKHRGRRRIRLYYNEFDAKGFYSFLNWVAFQENAALRGMPKLAELLLKFISPDVEKRNIECLNEYTKNNRHLHVEGYVHFRMAEYNDYLNYLMYAIVKKTKV